VGQERNFKPWLISEMRNEMFRLNSLTTKNPERRRDDQNPDFMFVFLMVVMQLHEHLGSFIKNSKTA
jgi:hypothetical protein